MGFLPENNITKDLWIREEKEEDVTGGHFRKGQTNL
jgi:hypothetical protein